MAQGNGLILAFPHEDTIQVVLSALRDREQIIQSLLCEFTDDNFIVTQQLRDNLLIGITSTLGNINRLGIQNSCQNLEKRNQCFDYFLQCLSGQQNKTKKFGYLSSFPLTLIKANKLSIAITSNDNIDSLGFFDHRGMFSEEDTFEIIFEAVLNNAAIKSLSLSLNSTTFRRIVERNCFTNSTLSTNVTLRTLRLGNEEIEFLFFLQNMTYKDEGMNQLANILKVNKGLHNIYFRGNIITNVGHRYLFDSLLSNTTLLKMDFSHCDMTRIENDEEQKNQIVLQSKTDSQVQVNSFWRHCNCENRKARRGDKKLTNMDTLPVKVYPNLLERVAKKPLLLYLLLQKKNPVLFDTISEQERAQPRQRRSMRVLKKRRITKEQAK